MIHVIRCNRINRISVLCSIQSNQTLGILKQLCFKLCPHAMDRFIRNWLNFRNVCSIINLWKPVTNLQKYLPGFIPFLYWDSFGHWDLGTVIQMLFSRYNMTQLVKLEPFTNWFRLGLNKISQCHTFLVYRLKAKYFRKS